jgi:hypothetical protein
MTHESPETRKVDPTVSQDDDKTVFLEGLIESNRIK